MNLIGFDKADIRMLGNFFRMFVRDRFMGSRLGSFWAIASPVMLLAIYTFVFGFVFKAKLPGAETSFGYAIWLIAGFGPWLAMSEAMVAAANSIHSNAGLVKNMAFKTELLPIAASMMGMIPLLVSVVFLAILLAIDGNPITWHAIIIVPVTLLMFAFVAALGLGLSVLVAFFRDIGVALPNLLTIILFASPIFYPLSAMPHIMQQISHFNPFYILANWVRVPLLEHQFPPLWGLLWVLLLTLVVGALTLAAFRRVRGYLHSVI